MRCLLKSAVLISAAVLPATLRAQFDFDVAGRKVQVHSFASQGFAYSDDNNYLTMKTSKGSFAMTDVGVNASVQLTDRLRVGAQFYTRNVGNLGNWEPQLDWVTADYRFKDWFGIRGGVVKTVFGLHNDTQDMEFLHTNALLPQSIYPTDLRDALIRHRGGDLYGTIPLGKRLGSLSYTGFAGVRHDGQHGGYIYLLRGSGIDYSEYGGLQYGGDLRWNTPINGLRVGASHMNQRIDANGTWAIEMAPSQISTIPTEEHSKHDWANQFYADYSVGKLRVEGEYRRWWRDEVIFSGSGEVATDTRAWYVLAAYRFSPRFELGSYYSHTGTDWTNMYAFPGAPPSVTTAPPSSSPDRHVNDKVVTARFDLNNHWNVKVEGHFMDGWGGSMYPNGFYTADNPGGLKPKTNVLIIRTGWNF